MIDSTRAVPGADKERKAGIMRIILAVILALVVGVLAIELAEAVLVARDTLTEALRTK